MATKTKRPNSTVTESISVTVRDTLTDTEYVASGTLAIHQYSDGTRLAFAKVATLQGLATLKLRFNPNLGWEKENQSAPCASLAVLWHELAATVQRLAA